MEHGAWITHDWEIYDDRVFDLQDERAEFSVLSPDKSTISIRIQILFHKMLVLVLHIQPDIQPTFSNHFFVYKSFPILNSWFGIVVLVVKQMFEKELQVF